MNPATIRWNTFVMRLWNDSPSGPWRGEIVHLQSKESCHFATWAQAEAFVRRYIPNFDSQAETYGSQDETQ